MGLRRVTDQGSHDPAPMFSVFLSTHSYRLGPIDSVFLSYRRRRIRPRLRSIAHVSRRPVRTSTPADPRRQSIRIEDEARAPRPSRMPLPSHPSGRPEGCASCGRAHTTTPRRRGPRPPTPRGSQLNPHSRLQPVKTTSASGGTRALPAARRARPPAFSRSRAESGPGRALLPPELPGARAAVRLVPANILFSS